MAETLIFSTGSRIISGTLTSTASISQLNLDGVTGSFVGDGSALTGIVSVSHAIDSDTSVLAISSVTSLTASYVAGANVDGTVESAATASFLLGSVETASFVEYDDVANKPALISSSAQFDANDNFVMNNLDVDGDLEVRNGGGLRIGHFTFLQGPDPTDTLAQSQSLTEFQMIGGNEIRQSLAMLVRYSNTGSNAAHLIFAKSSGASIGSGQRPFDGDALGGLLWSITDGFSAAFRVHAASINAQINGFTAQAGFVGADLVFSVAQNVSANDITEAMRLRSDLTLELTGSLAHAGPNLGFYSTSPIALQTGVAVTDVAIHAALVALGLITA